MVPTAYYQCIVCFIKVQYDNAGGQNTLYGADGIYLEYIPFVCVSDPSVIQYVGQFSTVYLRKLTLNKRVAVQCVVVYLHYMLLYSFFVCREGGTVVGKGTDSVA